MTPLERAHYVRDHMPAEGLFAEKTWRIAPRPFALSSTHVELIEKLGTVLHRFNQACNLLYRQSATGQGIPLGRVAARRGQAAGTDRPRPPRQVKGQTSAVIRPDPDPHRGRFALSELDSVPGGIGLTAWLGETYSDLGETVLGGRDGMRTHFESILNGGEVLISEESAGYRPKWNSLSARTASAPSRTTRPAVNPPTASSRRSISRSSRNSRRRGSRASRR